MLRAGICPLPLIPVAYSLARDESPRRIKRSLNVRYTALCIATL